MLFIGTTDETLTEFRGVPMQKTFAEAEANARKLMHSTGKQGLVYLVDKIGLDEYRVQRTYHLPLSI